MIALGRSHYRTLRLAFASEHRKCILRIGIAGPNFEVSPGAPPEDCRIQISLCKETLS